jgi:hexosaminidase
LDIQDLIEYARQRAIRIVPEFDMPAHTASWFVGYPYLASTRKSAYQLKTTWGVLNATMDVTRQSTYDFLEKFFSEMTQLFPDEYFHIGGDECLPYEWMESEEIQKFIIQKQLRDHQDLQAYFTRRVEKILNKFNREYYCHPCNSKVIIQRSSVDDVSNACVDKEIDLQISTFIY